MYSPFHHCKNSRFGQFVMRLKPTSSGDPSRRVAQFSVENHYNYSTLLLGKDGEKLYVGARDAFFSIDTVAFGRMELVKELPWKATEMKIQECSFKGKSSERDCFNFILLVLPVNESCLYACGTYAFSPTCAYIDVQTFSLLTDSTGNPLTEDGKGRIPFDPSLRYTASMVEGSLYTGTTNNFHGTQYLISRSLGHQVPLKTEPSCNWLQDPSFAGSTFIPEPDGDKVYFFFTESRSRSDLLQRISVTLVARVCKSDVGGERVLQKRWTTFLKAQLSCYLPEDKFPLNMLQDVFVSKNEQATVIYGVFSSQWFHGGSYSSAVCAFTLADVQAVFEGKYKILNREQQVWSTYTGEVPEPRPGACNTGRSSDSTLNLLKDLFLMDGVVHPIGHRPQLTKVRENYVKIAVDSVAAVNAVMHRVMFLITDRGFLHKALCVNNVSHIVEEIQLFPSPHQVHSLELSATKGVLYIGSSTSVLQVPVSNCSAYSSCGECVLSRDPYCAWDKSDLACKETRHQVNWREWIQDIENADAATVCPPPPVRPRPRMLVPKGSAEGPAGTVEKMGHLGALVTLPCEVESRLAQTSWTHGGREVQSWEASQQPRGIVLAATSDRQGLWQCWATENGFRVLVSSYSLRVAGACPPPPISDIWLGDSGTGCYTYWKELMAVSGALACLVLLAAGLALRRHCSNLRARSKVRQCPEVPGISESELETAPLNKSPVDGALDRVQGAGQRDNGPPSDPHAQGNI
ncbi:semaphorin-4B-like isoform X2 [Narcine bancroftii]|uniref:semaphorin-4B-like isoform X2 n=1 Tax=Narcine bancroftii TaxID=1343680 RepID=UPI0038318A7B